MNAFPSRFKKKNRLATSRPDEFHLHSRERAELALGHERAERATKLRTEDEGLFRKSIEKPDVQSINKDLSLFNYYSMSLTLTAHAKAPSAQ